MKRILLMSAAAAILGSGCVPAPINATFEMELVDMEDLDIPWPLCPRNENGVPTNLNCEDPSPIVIRLDARVRNFATLEPANNVRAWFNSTFPGVFFLPTQVVEAIDLPGGRWNQSEAAGEIYAEFSGNVEGDYHPTYHETWTDNGGLATTWMVIDELPVDDAFEAGEVQLIASIATDSAPFKLTPSR